MFNSGYHMGVVIVNSIGFYLNKKGRELQTHGLLKTFLFTIQKIKVAGVLPPRGQQ
jgi:hypothetical protein